MAQFDEYGCEDDLGRAVRAAYEAMGPAKEAQERMLTGLRAAVGQAEGAQEKGAQEEGACVEGARVRAAQAKAAPAKVASKRGAVADDAPRRLRALPWWARVALPAAACLALVAGVGVLYVQGVEGASVGSDMGEADLLVGDAQGQMESEASGIVGAMEAPEGSANAAGVDGCAPAPGCYGEGYTDAGEPDFVSAAEQPLSTLSADADTASYANLRRLVRSGAGLGTIDPGAVRIEEMLNYFDYDYAAPAEGEDFALTARAGACPWNAESELVVLGLTVGQAVTEAPPTNLVLLVDVSGSMGDAEKLPLLKESMARIVKGLRAEDRVSIVTYSGVEEAVLKGASGDDAEAILGAINGLEAAGSTNGEAGLSMAYRVAEETHIEGGVNRIVMASDGDLNVGISSEDELNAFVSEKRGQGIYLSVLGFGSGNYQDAKMETLADHGNGSYHYIDSADEAARVYERFLAAGAVPVADDVKLQVEFDSQMVESYRLIGYANRVMADDDFRNDGADAGELCAGAELTVAYEVVLTDEGRRREGDEPWLTCAVRYQPAGERAGEAPAEQRFSVGRESWSAEPGDDWSLAAAVIEFGMLARDSEFVGTATADDAAALAESSASSLDATDRAARRELTDLIRQAQRDAAFDGVVAAS